LTVQTKNVEVIKADGLSFTVLNELIRAKVDAGCREIVLNDICGQRYIGCGLGPEVHITINGVPGNDLAMFMGGARLVVNANAQDCVANTMDSGEIVIHGRSGDTLGHGMRGGEIYVRDGVGTRVGIHMKSFEDKKPVVVIGGCAGNFLGEYMAGGILIVLGLNRGGKDIKVFELTDEDRRVLEKYVRKYCGYFEVDEKKIFQQEFIKLEPFTHRPYGKLYAY
jgi:glutamate synthase domain-containing protein 3